MVFREIDVHKRKGAFYPFVNFAFDDDTIDDKDEYSEQENR